MRRDCVPLFGSSFLHEEEILLCGRILAHHPGPLNLLKTMSMRKRMITARGYRSLATATLFDCSLYWGYISGTSFRTEVPS
jgi:hypothetical protein